MNKFNLGKVRGEDGKSATIAIGTVRTGQAGSDASVNNAGDSLRAIFDFTIPRGDKGEKGERGNEAYSAGTGIDITDGTISVKYGTAAGTAAQGNDSRITGAAQKAANLSDLSSAGAARQNLGLGTAATMDVGTTSGNVMEVGAFGLGSSPNVFVADLNEGFPQKTAFFKWTASATNAPTSIGSGLYIARTDGFFDGHRLLFSHDQNRAWLQARTQVTGTFLPAVEILHTGNILTTTGQSTQYPMTQKAVTDAINGISDERDKTDVNEIGLGLEVIENIKAFSFKLNKRDWYRREAAKELIEVEEDGKVTIQEKINDDVLNSPLSNFEENDGSLKRDDVYTGFVAQDLKETLEELGLGHFGIVKNYANEYEGGEDRFYIEHLALLPFLVNSVKQLSLRVKELEDAAK